MKKILLSAILCVAPFASASADDWGTVTGQVIVSGNVPAAELLHKQGADIKDKEVCAAADTYKDDLVINPTSNGLDRKSTRLNSSHIPLSRMPSSA